MPLSNTKINSTAPKGKPFKLADEKGLFLLVNPNGSRYWRLRYRIAGKEKSLSLGIFPEVGLKEARIKRDEARQLLADGFDPSDSRKLSKAITTAESAILAAKKRFLLNNNGALSFALGNRHLSLSVSETQELRIFLDATKEVANAPI